MPSQTFIRSFLLNEAEAMLARLRQVRPFTGTMIMVRSATVSDKAFAGVNSHLDAAKNKLRDAITSFIHRLKQENSERDAGEWQGRFTVLKMRFNSILDQIDIYADVLSQRSEQETGTWLRGLDLLAEDALKPGAKHYEIPALMVYLDRGHGAAIRRARTRLPGGDLNPVAVIQIPRERMVGCGIASSLIHETGHQAAELLGWTKALKATVNEIARKKTRNKKAWLYFERWVSEIVADCWAIAQLGVTATQGLMGVVTLPSYFQFRLDLDDPHPAPYIRVLLSCRTGAALFPDPQWERLERMWNSFYPVDELHPEKQQDIQELTEEMPEFIRTLLGMPLSSLGNKKIIDLMPLGTRQPQQLRKLFSAFRKNQITLGSMSPTLLFAVLGQAKADFRLCAQSEYRLLQQQLKRRADQSVSEYVSPSVNYSIN